MPSIPAAPKASFTSSNLKGLMMASIFFIIFQELFSVGRQDRLIAQAPLVTGCDSQTGGLGTGWRRARQKLELADLPAVRAERAPGRAGFMRCRDTRHAPLATRMPHG